MGNDLGTNWVALRPGEDYEKNFTHLEGPDVYIPKKEVEIKKEIKEEEKEKQV